MSFIPEVQLCMSSLPGGELGVCCRTEIPKDTVIGPYKGRRVRAEDMQISNGGNMTYVWEVRNFLYILIRFFTYGRTQLFSSLSFVEHTQTFPCEVVRLLQSQKKAFSVKYQFPARKVHSIESNNTSSFENSVKKTILSL